MLELGVEDFFELLERSQYASAVFNYWPSYHKLSWFSSAFVQILRLAPFSKISIESHTAIPF